jgi:hypothetical protein
MLAKLVNGRMWIAGQSGNPAGRPVGARGRFSQQFIEDMRASWERHGATVMDRVAALHFNVHGGHIRPFTCLVGSRGVSSVSFCSSRAIAG